MSQPLASTSTVPTASPNWAQQLLDGLASLRDRVLGALKASLVILMVCAGMGLAWRFLDLYEMAVRAETVQAQIALERHKFMMEELKRGKSALTQEQVRQAVATAAAGTAAAAEIPEAHK